MGPTTNATPAKASSIESAINRQVNAVGNLEDMVERLISRLEPATSKLKSGGAMSGDEKADDSGSSTFACNIDSLRRRIEALDGRIGHLIDNLEI